jgi:hypothetical protein
MDTGASRGAMTRNTQTLGDGDMVNVTRLRLKRHHPLGASVAVAMGLLLLTLPIAQALTFGSPTRITTNTSDSEYPSLATSGNYVYIAWMDWTPVPGSGSAPEVWIRVSSNNGASFGSPVRITTNTGNSKYSSLAASGSYVYVAWQDDTPVPGSGSAAEIWMRVSSNYGASFGSAIRLTTNTGDSWYPSVAAVGNNVYVAWDDNTPVTGSGTSPEIWMRISANNGASFGSPVRITTNTGYSTFPSVAAVGGYVYVAWMDNTPVQGSSGAYEVWLRASSNYGASFGSPVRITTNTGYSGDPSVAALAGNVYVAWNDFTPVSGSGISSEIWLRVSSNYGASFGSPIRITTNTGNSVNPSVATVGSNVYIAWQDNTRITGSGSGYEVWLRASSNSGASFGSPIRITTNTGDSEYPSVAASGSNVYVAWDDNTPVTGSGTAPEIWMRVSSNYGASFGSAIRMSTNTGWSGAPSVAASGSYVYVAWDDDTPVTDSGSAYEIWMRISDDSGASFGSPIRLSSNAYMSLYPSVAASGGNVYAAWQDETPVTGSGSKYEVWLRASSNSGALFGSPIRITTNTGDSYNPSVASWGSYVYVAWEDWTPVTGSGIAPEIWMRAGS